MRKGVWSVCIVVAVILCVLFAFVACERAAGASGTEGVTEPAATVVDGGSEDPQEEEPSDADIDGEGEGSAEDADSESEDGTDDEDEEGDTEGEGVSVDEYLAYLYDNDRLAYYKAAAQYGVFDLLPVDMFDLTTQDAAGRYPYLLIAETLQGDHSLIAHGAEVAGHIRISADGQAEVCGSFGEATFTLCGRYNKETDVITESGETFALSEDVTTVATLLYYLPIGENGYLITIRPEQGIVSIDEDKDVILTLLSEYAMETPQEEEPTGDKEQTDDRILLSASRCYAFLQAVGGTAEVAGEPIITEEGEQYTVLFRAMTDSEYTAAMRLWREDGNVVYFDNGTQIEFSRMIEGIGFSFNVTAEGSAAPYTMTVRVQGAYLS